MFGMFFFITQFMQNVLKFSPIKAGLAFLPMTLLLFTVSRFIPKLLPEFRARATGPDRHRPAGLPA